MHFYRNASKLSPADSFLDFQPIGNCRSTPARHAANPYRQKRPPNA